jgi:hypothetical protein
MHRNTMSKEYGLQSRTIFEGKLFQSTAPYCTYLSILHILKHSTTKQYCFMLFLGSSPRGGRRVLRAASLHCQHLTYVDMLRMSCCKCLHMFTWFYNILHVCRCSRMLNGGVWGGVITSLTTWRRLHISIKFSFVATGGVGTIGVIWHVAGL